MALINTSAASAASSPAITKASLLAKYAGKASDDLKSLTLTIYGPSGGGKSTAVLKLSKYCPDELKPVAPGTAPVVTEDMLVVSYDKGGMMSGLPYGLDVPRISVSDICYAEGKDVGGLRELLPIRTFHRNILFPAIQEAYAAGVRIFVYDTITSMAGALAPELEKSCVTNQGAPDTMRYWVTMNSTMTEFYQFTASFPGATVVYLGHSVFKEDFIMADKSKGESKDEAAAKAKQKRETLDPYLSKITIAMPGKTGEIFMNQSSLTLALKLMLNPKSQDYDRYFVVDPGETDSRAKNRFIGWLNPQEKADLRLIMNKIGARS
jgi:hypothetical protein